MAQLAPRRCSAPARKLPVKLLAANAAGATVAPLAEQERVTWVVDGDTYEVLAGGIVYHAAPTNAVVAAPLVILPVNSPAPVNQAMVASFPAAPPAANLVVGMVGINFYQQVNGKFYPLNSNSTDPLAIEYGA
ncbi:hypothetical protein [Hymenobacter glaciei]|uniref:hypothetical protein n=1 Tax=Hymenobacter glaciei TaxID=877209 RepID=UPI0031F0AEBE